MRKPPGGQKFCPQTDSDGIFPPAVNGNASYYHGISNDPPVTFTFRNDEYEVIYWMYGGNSSDLCCCVWIDLSYDGAFLLSYCREKITITMLNSGIDFHFLLSDKYLIFCGILYTLVI